MVEYEATEILEEMGALSPERPRFDIPISLLADVHPLPESVREKWEAMPSSKDKVVTLDDIEARLTRAEERRAEFRRWVLPKARVPNFQSKSSEDKREKRISDMKLRLQAAENARCSHLEAVKQTAARLAAPRSATVRTSDHSAQHLAERIHTQLAAAHMRRLEREQRRQGRLAEKQRRRSTKWAELQAKQEAEGSLAAARLEGKLEAAQNLREAAIKARAAQKRSRRGKGLMENSTEQQDEENLKFTSTLEGGLSVQLANQRKCRMDEIRRHISSRKLQKCWREFMRVKRTTRSLAQAWLATGVSVLEPGAGSPAPSPRDSMPLSPGHPSPSTPPIVIVGSLASPQPSPRHDSFDTFAARLRSAGTLRAASVLLSRLQLRLAAKSSTTQPGGIRSHRRLISQGGRGTQQSARYPPRIFLCAYMIMRHPEVVFNASGEREAALAAAAREMVAAFELLMQRIVQPLPAPNNGDEILPLEPSPLEHGMQCYRASLASRKVAGTVEFSFPRLENCSSLGIGDLLVAFDAAWLSYFDQFSAWKGEDAAALEAELVSMAVRMEQSLRRKVAEDARGKRRSRDDLQAMNVQVAYDLHLLRERVRGLSGDAGVARFERALAASREAENSDTAGGSATTTDMESECEKASPSRKPSGEGDSAHHPSNLSSPSEHAPAPCPLTPFSPPNSPAPQVSRIPRPPQLQISGPIPSPSTEPMHRINSPASPNVSPERPRAIPLLISSAGPEQLTYKVPRSSPSFSPVASPVPYEGSSPGPVQAQRVGSSPVASSASEQMPMRVQKAGSMEVTAASLTRRQSTSPTRSAPSPRSQPNSVCASPGGPGPMPHLPQPSGPAPGSQCASPGAPIPPTPPNQPQSRSMPLGLASAAFSNAQMVMELLYDSSYKLPSLEADAAWLRAVDGKTGPPTPLTREELESVAVEQLESVLKAHAHAIIDAAFWDSFKRQLTDALALGAGAALLVAPVIAEMGAELAGVVGGEGASGTILQEFGKAAVTAAVEEGDGVGMPQVLGFQALFRLLQRFATALNQCGSPAREDAAVPVQQSMSEALHCAAAAAAATLASGSDHISSDQISALASAITHALRVLYAQLRLLKLDTANARLQLLARAISGHDSAKYLRSKFCTFFSIPESPAPLAFSEISCRLSRTLAWLRGSVPILEPITQSITSLSLSLDVDASSLTSGSQPPSVTMRTGRGLTEPSSSTLAPATRIRAIPTTPQTWRGVVRSALITLISGDVAAVGPQLPETLVWDGERVHSAQNEYQKMVVMAICMMLLMQSRMQQAARAGGTGAWGPEERATARRRLLIVLSDPNMKLPSLVTEISLLAGMSTQSGEEQLRGALTSFLRPDNPAYSKIRTMLSAVLTWYVLTCGRAENCRTSMAAALARCGAAELVEDVEALAVRLLKLAEVSEDVFRPYYEVLISQLVPGSVE